MKIKGSDVVLGLLAFIGLHLLGFTNMGIVVLALIVGGFTYLRRGEE